MIARIEAQLTNKDMGLELTDERQEAAGEEGLRPGAGRPAAAPHDPARDRGHAVRADPLQRAGPGQIVVVDTTGEGEAAEFTFRGEPKPAPVPDIPLVADIAGGAAEE